jgi:putative NADPH-quinone reductase
MRTLVIFCHPVETSYHAALHTQVLESLRKAGHEVDDCDLYAEGFNPVMSREERLGYHQEPSNRLPVQRYVERLLWAEALVFCFPVWTFGPPAMLKGFFDRTMMPGVAFDISDPANVKPALTHIKSISAVVTYGRARWNAWLVGDPPRKLVKRILWAYTNRKARVQYHALYHMNVATLEQRDAFKQRVARAMEQLR